MAAYVPEFILITFIAAVVNGALGYGFSSITVPLALLFLSHRVLNPALVLVEVLLNAYVLWVNRDAVPHIARRMLPIVIGLTPGIALGTLAVAMVKPDWLKLWTFLLLLPLILMQAGGFRRPVRAERAWGLPFGVGVGALYALTTISGPPLALMLNNQGLAKREFRAALGFVRLAESSIAALFYWYAGLFTAEAVSLAPVMLPSLLIGVPLGAWIIRHVDADAFRRLCLSFDAWIVGFGISTLLRLLHILEGAAAYSALAAVIAVDSLLLYRFFVVNRRRPGPEARPV